MQNEVAAQLILLNERVIALKEAVREMIDIARSRLPVDTMLGRGHHAAMTYSRKLDQIAQIGVQALKEDK